MFAQVKAGFLASAAPVAGGGPAVCTFQTSAVDGSDTTTYTFSSQAIGPGASDRHVIVSVSVRAATNISSVTVAGQSCSLFNHQSGSGARTAFAITDAPVTSGTTATIVVTCTGSPLACGIGVYSATGLSSTTPIDSDFTTTDAAGITIDVLAEGFVIAGSINRTSSTWTWTNVTEDFDEQIEAASAWHSGGSASTPSNGTLTVTADVSAVSSFRAYASSWR